jgi:hypothetical protein
MADSGEESAKRAEMDVDLPSRSSDAGGLQGAARRLQDLLEVKIKHDAAIARIDKCVAEGVISAAEAAHQRSLASRALIAAKANAGVVADGRELNSGAPAAEAESKRGRGRQVGSKNTPRTGLDDLQDKTLCQVCKDLELAWTDRAQAITAIHLRSGSSAKSPKTNLDDLKEDTLVLICADRNLASSGNRADLIARILGRGGRGLTSEDSKDANEPDRSAEMDVDPSSRSSDGGGPRGSPGIQKKTKRAAGGAKDYKNGDFIIFVNRLAVVRDDQKLQETKKRDGGDKKPKPSSPWTALRPGDEKYGKVWDDPEHFAWECLKGEREGGDKKRSIKIDRHDDSGPVDLYPKIPREKKDSTVEKQRVANERAVGDGTPCDYACVFPS